MLTAGDYKFIKYDYLLDVTWLTHFCGGSIHSSVVDFLRVLIFGRIAVS